jgi:hypothetical protein
MKTRKRFLYNPNNPKKSFDVYIDKNPKDTIHIKYTTIEDVKNTICDVPPSIPKPTVFTAVVSEVVEVRQAVVHAENPTNNLSPDL